MQNIQIVQSVAFIINLACLGLLFYLFLELKKVKLLLTENSQKNPEGNKLKLQALERLSLYAERCGLNNMIRRTESTGLSAAAYHHVLTETIKGEYEYNMSQQIYVIPELWNAVTRLKDQNIYIINQLTSNLPPEATATDLGKMIIEYSMTPNAEMNKIVLDALQFEAQKLLN